MPFQDLITTLFWVFCFFDFFPPSSSLSPFLFLFCCLFVVVFLKARERERECVKGGGYGELCMCAWNDDSGDGGVCD